MSGASSGGDAFTYRRQGAKGGGGGEEEEEEEEEEEADSPLAEYHGHCHVRINYRFTVVNYRLPAIEIDIQDTRTYIRTSTQLRQRRDIFPNNKQIKQKMLKKESHPIENSRPVKSAQTLPPLKLPYNVAHFYFPKNTNHS